MQHDRDSLSTMRLKRWWMRMTPPPTWRSPAIGGIRVTGQMAATGAQSVASHTAGGCSREIKPILQS
jgi:hypothetical protein